MEKLLCGSRYLLMAAISVLILKDDTFFDFTLPMKYSLNCVLIYVCDAVDEFCLFQSLQWVQLILSTAKHWHENLYFWCRVEYIHSLHLILACLILSLLSPICPKFLSLLSLVLSLLSTNHCPWQKMQKGQELWTNSGQKRQKLDKLKLNVQN